MTDYRGFQTWADLLAYIRAGYKVFYHAPMDYRPAVVQTAIRKDGKVRVTPVYGAADPFTADKGHLGRFRRLAKSGE